jgi:branched-subunit amino acid transport protein
VLAFFTFESLAALPTAIFERPVFYMQRGQKYYHTSPYVLSHLIAEVLALPTVHHQQCIVY